MSPSLETLAVKTSHIFSVVLAQVNALIFLVLLNQEKKPVHDLLLLLSFLALPAKKLPYSVCLPFVALALTALLILFSVCFIRFLVLFWCSFFFLCISEFFCWRVFS